MPSLSSTTLTTRSSINHHQPPLTNPQSSIPTHHSPIPNHPSPITNHQSPSPISPAPVSTWNAEQVAKAAKSLAEFFRGEIISLTDDVLDLSATGVSPDVEIYETDYDYD
ncbi:hypothetical protein [Sphaerospermopsis reniformis]|uniref:hypothetical protein n=1 Tax=Sphaerospermopsis reniformis TaxID=531300 RepID=UPI001913C33F|nr:hypothetical protein [Sphaerospermopsis reniformis]